jgi:hypothetical protein
MKRTSSELRLAVASLPPTIFQAAKIATLPSQRSVMAMLSSIGRSEHLGNARGNDRCSLYCNHGRAAGQCVRASVGFSLNSTKTSAIIV